MSNFHRLDVVSRSSETQLQVGGNLNLITFVTAFFYLLPNEVRAGDYGIGMSVHTALGDYDL